MFDTLKSELGATAAEVDAHFQSRFAILDPLLRDAMLHAVIGGKKMRAFLVRASGELYHLSGMMPAMAAIEAMHAYSLVHDDLPAMDDDDLRRGKPTVHKQYGEATAILVGDALQSLSFEMLTELTSDFPRTYITELIARMARSAGANGMVLGQAQDIAAETSAIPLDLARIADLQANKTGALIYWSATSGAVLAGADDSALSAYARALGLAFQIQDDVLDVTGSADQTGKAVGKDADAGKATFVSLMGLDGAKEAARTCVETAKDALHPFGDKAASLRQLADYTIMREN